MLYNINRLYLLIGIMLYTLLIGYWSGNVFNYAHYNILNILTFCSFIFTIWNNTNKPESYYSEYKIVAIVFLYSIVFVSLYMMMSDYYTDNTFIFSEADARNYERTSFAIKDMSFLEAIRYIVIARGWTYEDWGAPMFMGFILKLIPSKLFLNFVYVGLNTLGALFLFRIGKFIMSVQYAFLATLAYAISSYSVFFMGVFLKEQIMVFLVITSLYLLYEYWENKHMYFLVLGGVLSSLLFFFRPAITVFVWISYAVMMMSGTKSNVVKLSFIIVGIGVLGLTYSAMMQSAERFDDASKYVNSTFSEATKIVVYLGGLVGPFPAIFQTQEIITYKPLFGSGLLYKFLLFFPFWKGFVYCLKSRSLEVLPLFSFVVVEILSLYFVLDTLELRKSMPHVPLFILAAFWYMDKYDDDADEDVQQTPYYVWSRRQLFFCAFLVFAMSLVWNTMK